MSKPLLEQTKWFYLLVVLLVTAICFTPCLDADFVNWDDPVYIYKNDAIQNFEFSNLSSWIDIVTDFNPTVSYAPLTSLTFGFEKALYGFDSPHLFHLDNLILHLVVVALVYFLSVSIGFPMIYAALIAVLFGIHPMRVESVAWLTERKDLLYALFYFWALLSYVLMKKKGFSKAKYFAILFIFLLSLMSKIQAVTLPVAFLLIDYLFDGNWRWRHIWLKVPFFLLALVFGMIGVLYTTGDPTHVIERSFDLHNGIMWTSNTLWAYVYKLIIPYPLLPMYRFPTTFNWYQYLTILIPLIGTGSIIYSWYKGYKMLFFGLAFFALNVMFTLPLMPMGQSYQSDRFTYVAYFGIFILLAYGIRDLLDDNNKFTTAIKFVLSGYLLYLMYTSYTQTGVWKNSETLWTHQISFDNNNESVYLNRLAYYESIGNTVLAEQDLNMAMRSKPKMSKTFHLKGKYLIAYGQDSLANAIAYLNKAIEIEPDKYEGYYVNRAVALGKNGQINEAISDLNHAIQINPLSHDAYLNRAVLFQRTNQIEKSLQDIDKYLLLKPDDNNVKSIREQLLNIDVSK